VPNATKLTKDLTDASDTMVGIALQLGRQVGVSDESIGSSMKMYIKHMNASMNNTCVNVSVLMDRYLKFCQGLQRDPTVRLTELLTVGPCKSTYKCD
jgi:hypothetical protein